MFEYKPKKSIKDLTEEEVRQILNKVVEQVYKKEDQWCPAKPELAEVIHAGIEQCLDTAGLRPEVVIKPYTVRAEIIVQAGDADHAASIAITRPISDWDISIPDTEIVLTGEEVQQQPQYRLPSQLLSPNDSINSPVNTLPLHPMSNAYIKSAGSLTQGLRPHFGSQVWEGEQQGFSITLVDSNTPTIPVLCESPNNIDKGLLPIPIDAAISGGERSEGDRYILAIDPTQRLLYELYRASLDEDQSVWKAEAAVCFDLKKPLPSRPIGKPAAGGGGLPILPTIIRWEEIEAGEIQHAIRVSFPNLQAAYVLPASFAESNVKDEDYLPFGLRFRLKDSFDISGFSKVNQIILKAMKVYGLIVADCGMPWTIHGDYNLSWNDADLLNLHKVTSDNFEVVYTGATIPKI